MSAFHGNFPRLRSNLRPPDEIALARMAPRRPDKPVTESPTVGAACFGSRQVAQPSGASHKPCRKGG